MDFGTLAPPPDQPELPDATTRWPAWPWWFALAGFGAAFLLTNVFGGILAVATGVAGEDPPPGFVIAATLIQNVVFLGTAYLLARAVSRPRAWHFGLRSTPPAPALGWAALGLVVFFVLSGVWGVLVQVDAEQDVVQDLGGDSGTLGMVLAGIVIVAMAPYAEELFFRGFFYRALRTSIPVGWAAAFNGVVFGLLHFGLNGIDGLLLIVPLGFLGAIFCLVYEKTGSLFPVIAMHAFNNALAYAVSAGGDAWIVSAIVGPLVIGSCFLLPRILPSVPMPAEALSRPPLPAAGSR